MDGAFTRVAEGAFQLADVGGVYLPFVGRPPYDAASEPKLKLHSDEIKELTPTKITSCQPEPLVATTIGHRVDYATINLQPAFANVYRGLQTPEEWVVSDH